ncbi:hypothetical protein [Pseudomonas sp. NPDC007930]|uniref:hypothetical protein n=1 Tax=Pseudomonas sp. NPDC007930 TaxID=3364417 RepID=UPI0036EA203F
MAGEFTTAAGQLPGWYSVPSGGIGAEDADAPGTVLAVPGLEAYQAAGRARQVRQGYRITTTTWSKGDQPMGLSVSVEDANGNLGALIQTPTVNGYFAQLANGARQWQDEPPSSSYIEREAPAPENATPALASVFSSAQPYDVPIAFGFSGGAQLQLFKAQAALLSDPTPGLMYGLAQVAFAQAMLDAAGLGNIHLTMVGLQRVDDDYAVAPRTLSALESIFPVLATQPPPFTVFAAFFQHVTYASVAWKGTRIARSVNAVQYPFAFQHALSNHLGLQRPGEPAGACTVPNPKACTPAELMAWARAWETAAPRWARLASAMF